MRIFQVLSAPATGGIARSSIWLRNLHEPLVELGHDVLLWRFGWASDGDLSDRLVRDFRREHERKPFDLLFAYVQDAMLEPGAVQEIARTGVTTCNFSCNNTHQFALVEKLSKVFHYNLYAEKHARDKFAKLGSRAVWFPMAANPHYYKPLPAERVIDVAFIGQEYARRYLYVWHLLTNGVALQVFGPGWRPNDGLSPARRWLRRTRAGLRAARARSYEDCARLSATLAHRDFVCLMAHRYPSNIHGPVSDEDMIRMYSASRISLGFLEVLDDCDPLGCIRQHVHLREFEAPMSGALYCTGYCDELTEFYEPDKELITYRSEHELLDKVNYYLHHPDEAERVRQAGRRRALACHTYQQRFRGLFMELGLG